MVDDASRRTAGLIALDWGTTSFRGWLLDDAGTVVDRVRSADGTLQVSERADSSGERAAAFDAAFARLCGHWLQQRADLPVIAAGMVGSNHGWAEAGYLDVPADLADLADHLTRVPGTRVHIVPGLRVPGPDPDVMRGEEVQLVGALAETERPSTVVLPGTHSKWVDLAGARVTTFTTAMTGELYGLLLRDSILARLATEPAGPAGPAGDEVSAAFSRGLDVEAARGDERGLAALLFTARTFVMAGRLDGADVADYVSGLLVGDEVRHAVRGIPADVVAVCGSRPVASRYRIALERHGATVRLVDEDAAARGLWQVALDAALVPAPATRTTEELLP
ncbi:2-dehydro-3-deoxygalactonokinase [Puerhibacterium puerhi]|uniref:2-dehydro-3-deoxygalactonokinase n=1 Tax=Puerhibacterium puerhi TaxID=2692623 RepID=UPI001358BC0F|nr:2-dehydro-3-deoxygalactonokinase [Puerhibacterium puerhi]